MIDGSGVDGPDLAAVARELLASDQVVAKELRKALRDSAKPILDAERAAVRALTFSTTRVERSRILRRKTETTTQGSGKTGGTAATRRAKAKATQSYSEAVATGKTFKTKKQWTALRARSGLRESVARGMRITAAERKGEMTVTVRTSASRMPPDQRTLPRLINYGRWRHPVFPKPGTGRKEWTWVYQTPDRVGWWWKTAEGEIPAAMTRTNQALDEIAKQISERVNRAAQSSPGRLGLGTTDIAAGTVGTAYAASVAAKRAAIAARL